MSLFSVKHSVPVAPIEMGIRICYRKLPLSTCNIYLGHILRLKEHCVTRLVLLQCVKPAPESLFGDVLADVYAAINLAMNRIEWKANTPSKSC